MGHAPGSDSSALSTELAPVVGKEAAWWRGYAEDVSRETSSVHGCLAHGVGVGVGIDVVRYASSDASGRCCVLVRGSGMTARDESVSRETPMMPSRIAQNFVQTAMATQPAVQSGRRHIRELRGGRR